MAHVQIINDKVVAVFSGPQDCEGYAEVADDDSRLVAFNAPKVPAAVSMRQARLALIAAGLDDDVEAAINGIADATERKKARATWDYSIEVQRNQPFVLMLAPALGLTSAQLDALFIAAAAL